MWGGGVFRNNCKGHMDKTKGGLRWGVGGEDDLGRGVVVGRKWRQLYLNNNEK